MNFSGASSEITKSLITEMKYIIFQPNEVTDFETLECTYHIMILTFTGTLSLSFSLSRAHKTKTQIFIIYLPEQNKFKVTYMRKTSF
jgi:hypothetical protein